MILKKIFIPFLIFSLTVFVSYGQSDAKQKGLDIITKESVKAQLKFLSSDWMEGRGVGTKGEFMAGDYLASMFQFMGILPAGDKERTRPTREDRAKGIRSEEYTSYFQNIYMTKRLESSANLSIISIANNTEYSFNENVDFSIYGSLTGIKLNAEIVFVGYGFADAESGYNDFKGVDVNNKIILRIAGHPGMNDTNSLGYKKFHKEERYFSYYLSRKKDKIAKEKGAIGVIEISDYENIKSWTKETDFQNMSYNEHLRAPIYDKRLSLPSDNINGSLLKINTNKKIINKILENQGIDIKQFEKNTANSLKTSSKKLKNIKLNIEYNVNTELVQTRNVLGVIEGKNKDEFIVIGAHYDHLGMKDGFIWNGADDNASGTVGVWMLAKAFAASGIKPEKTIVFAAWTGEEIGLKGSRYFANNPYGGKIENYKLCLNFDMISKDDDIDTLKNQASLTYTSSFSELEDISEKYILDYNLNLDISYRPSEKPRGGSDHSSFSSKNIPVMYYMAGFPITYHTPKDQTSDINWDKMVDIVKLAYLNIWDIVNK